MKKNDQNQEKGKTIVLLGGAGLVGCNLACLLVEQGYTVVCLDKNSHNLSVLKEACPRARVVELNVVNSPLLEQYLSGADVVVQLQAQITASSREPFVRNNIASVQSVLKACTAVGMTHLIHLSSSVVISVAHDDYTTTKREGEKLVIDSGIPYTILRPPLMYGCFDAKHLGYLAGLLKKSPIFPIPGSGKYVRQPLYVMDLCKIIQVLIERGPDNAIHNIIGKERIHFIDLIKTIATANNHTRLFLPLPVSLFMLLLRLYALITRRSPFTADQLKALTAGDDFPVIDWDINFGVPYTPFRTAVALMRQSPYAKFGQRMIAPHYERSVSSFDTWTAQKRI